MARKKTVTETVEVEEPGPPEPALPPDEQPPNVDEQALQLAISELGLDTGTVRIVAYRLRPNRDPEECSDCPFDQFNKNDLRDQFGPGDYMLQLRSKGLLRRKYTLHFASPVTVPALPAPVLSGADGGLAAQLRGSLAEIQAAHSAQMIDLLKAVLARDTGPRADPVSIGSAWLDQAIKLQSLIGRRGEGDDLERLAKLLEISRSLGGADGKGATGADVALELMRMTKPVLELARVSADAEARAMAPAAPSKKLLSKDSPMPTPLLRMGLQLLIRNAAADNDPRTYAELLIDNVPHPQLTAFLAGPAWFDQLCLLEPGATPHSAWFEELRGEVLALIQPPAPEPGLTAAAAAPETAARSEEPHVPSQPAAARNTRAPTVRGSGNARHAAPDARPGAAVQGSPAADRARARPGPRTSAKGRGRSG